MGGAKTVKRISQNTKINSQSTWITLNIQWQMRKQLGCWKGTIYWCRRQSTEKQASPERAEKMYYSLWIQQHFNTMNCLSIRQLFITKACSPSAMQVFTKYGMRACGSLIACDCPTCTHCTHIIPTHCTTYHTHTHTCTTYHTLPPTQTHLSYHHILTTHLTRSSDDRMSWSADQRKSLFQCLTSLTSMTAM